MTNSFAAALKGAKVEEAFLPVAAPASVIPDRKNEYYKNDDDLLAAIGEAMRTEYKMIVDAGHEIGAHGYSHENPIAMTREQESAVLDRCIDLIEKRAGRRPTGYVAPWWEFSPVTNELLLSDEIFAMVGGLGTLLRGQRLAFLQRRAEPYGYAQRA